VARCTGGLYWHKFVTVTTRLVYACTASVVWKITCGLEHVRCGCCAACIPAAAAVTVTCGSSAVLPQSEPVLPVLTACPVHNTAGAAVLPAIGNAGAAAADQQCCFTAQQCFQCSTIDIFGAAAVLPAMAVIECRCSGYRLARLATAT
jgi:hypothetical protein